MQILKLKSKDNTKQTLHAKFYASRVKTSEFGGGKIRPPPQFWSVFKSTVKIGLNVTHEENDVIEMQEELVNVKKQLKQGKHTCLIMRMEHPRAYEIC